MYCILGRYKLKRVVRTHNSNFGRYLFDFFFKLTVVFVNILFKPTKRKKTVAIGTKHPYYVYETGTEHFIDIKDLKTILIKNAKVDSKGNAVNWLKIRWLQYRKEDNKHIYLFQVQFGGHGIQNAKSYKKRQKDGCGQNCFEKRI